MQEQLRVLARTLRGIESIAATEVRSRLSVDRVELGHRELRFAVPELGPELLALGTIDDVFLVAAELDGITRHRESLGRLASVRLDLDALARLLDRSGRRTFDVVASFLGRRNYSRFEVEDAVGGGLAGGGWAYVAKRGELSFRVHIVGSSATVAARIARTPLHKRAYRVATVPGSLHPPLARALALLAGLRPDATFVDPFCGAGTIPIEARLACPGLRAAGFDLDEQALAAARRNASAARVEVAVARADAGALPLSDESVDCLVANPPWGAAVGLAGRLRNNPPAVARELERVLAPTGLAVLLTRGDFPRGSLPAVLETPVRVSGRLAELVVLSRRL